MSAPITKDQLNFTLGNLTYIGPDYDAGHAPIVKQGRKHGIHGWVARLASAVKEWNYRRTVVQELALMTDRELSDIGLTRSDISRVFDPAFAAGYARGRDYIAY
jgi:uncharacterized protein YjiS (DUF1127 family)